MNKLIIVTGLPRSGTSMMMRALEMGGVSCSYKEIPQINGSMKNPYGFFEGGVIPQSGGVAVKRFGKRMLEQLSSYDCYFIFMDRSPESIVSSWMDIASKSENFKEGEPNNFPIAKRIENTTKSKQQIFDYVKTKKHIVIGFEDMFKSTIPTLTLLKDFLPCEFNVEGAALAVDPSLYVEREGTPTAPKELDLTEEQKSVISTIELELKDAVANRDSVVSPLDLEISIIRKRLADARIKKEKK